MKAGQSEDAIRRVVLSGPEAVGKTELTRRLAQHFGTTWSAEYVRIFLEGQPPRDPPSLVLWEDLPGIVRGQVAAEDAAARTARDVLFCDTDLHSTKVYCEHYFGSCPDWLAKAARERRYDLHLLLGVDAPWTPDPMRDRPHLRQELWDHFRLELEGAGRRVVLIDGDWDARFERAAASVAGLLAEPFVARVSSS